MNGYLLAVDGSSPAPGRETVQRLLDEDRLAWLDLYQPGQAEIALLTGVLGIHPLAARSVEHFGQRPRLENYDGFTHMVAYGVLAVDKPLTEVHCFYSERYVVTARKNECPAFGGLRDRLHEWLSRPPGQPAARVKVLYHVLDELAEGYFPVLARFDDRVDELQDKIMAKPTDAQLSELFTMKRWLIGVRKIVTPQRDMMASLVAGVNELPGMTPDAERYFRDLYDHQIHLSDLVDSYRDLLTSSMDSYLSTVSNRLNQVMKQLTIIATIFLPLSFLTGFFGQNFGWMTGHMNDLVTFIGLGVGTEVVAVVGLLVLFRRRGWM